MMINSELNTETILSFLDSCFTMDSTASGGDGVNGQLEGKKPSNDPLRQLQESTQALWDRMAALEQILYLNQATYGKNDMHNGSTEKYHESMGREPKVSLLICQTVTHSNSCVSWISSVAPSSPGTRSPRTMS